jgi:hypothetical protein
MVPYLIGILHSGSWFLRVVPDLIYYIVFQCGSRFNILHSVSGWFQI